MHTMNPADMKLEHHMCFHLYAASKEVIRCYKPFLDPLDLTYTQYLALLVLWEQGTVSVKELGEKLYLDSGTMTPVLKKLESKGYIHRTRAQQDERSVLISLTEEGQALKARADGIPASVCNKINLTEDEKQLMQQMLRHILDGLRD